MRPEKILIVDDSEMNRAILADMLGESYDIMEAEDGVQAVEILQRMNASIDLVLLDIVMPRMDGFEVLTEMNRNHWIDDIPVIMVSAETEATQVERAYSLGVTDFIMRPFDAYIVRHRVVNTLILYAKQKQLIGMVEEQLYEKEKNSSMMVDILSHIVEFRNGESGLHVLHVRTITEFLLGKLMKLTDQYGLSAEEISMIGLASALHDIGKLGIDEKILNKPDRLTDEEYTIMKTHSMIGANMMENVALYQNEPLVKAAYEICRWHHERYDGKGYPDGLVGDAIPIAAQVVALADVYDALTSARVYKAPFEPEVAVRMILNGECGTFNPLLLECLKESAEELKYKLQDDITDEMSRREIRSFADAALTSKNNGYSDRMMHLMDYERVKSSFFSGISEEIRFEYAIASHIITLSSWSVKRPGMGELIFDPHQNERVQELISGINWKQISAVLSETTPDHPEVSLECQINCGGQPRWHRIVLHAIWSEGDPRVCEGALGKAIDIHEGRVGLEAAEYKDN